jgi:hypothetical protein
VELREVKIYLDDELNDRFRRTAMEAFGYGRGSISKAAEEALLQWCERRETTEKRSTQTIPVTASDEKQSPPNSSPVGEEASQTSKPSLPAGS